MTRRQRDTANLSPLNDTAGRLGSSDTIKLASTLCRWLRLTHCLCKYLATNPKQHMSGQAQPLSVLHGFCGTTTGRMTSTAARPCVGLVPTELKR
jgi:hypothetical protein